jgi:hypothetical protein
MAALRQARWLSRTCVAAMRSPRITSSHRVQPVQLLHNGTVASSSSVVCPPATAAVYETLGAPDQVLRSVSLLLLPVPHSLTALCLILLYGVCVASCSVRLVFRNADSLCSDC